MIIISIRIPIELKISRIKENWNAEKKSTYCPILGNWDEIVLRRIETLKWLQVEKLFKEAMEKVGNPPVHLIRPYEMKKHNICMGSFLGKCIYIKMNPSGNCIIEDGYISVSYRNRKKTDIRYTIYHELGHVLFPKKPHWWIECYGIKLAHSKGILGPYSYRYHHTPREIPTEEELLRISNIKSQKLNAMPHQAEIKK